MDFLDAKFNEFIDSDDFKEITKRSPALQQLLIKLYIEIRDKGIPVYPNFRENHSSQSGLKVINLKIQYPKRENWDNIATIVPNIKSLEVFAFYEGEPQESYFIDSHSLNDKEYLGKLIKELKYVYDIRVKK